MPVRNLRDGDGGADGADGADGAAGAGSEVDDVVAVDSEEDALALQTSRRVKRREASAAVSGCGGSVCHRDVGAIANKFYSSTPTEFSVTEHGMIAHRASAIREGKYELEVVEEGGACVIVATFKGVKKKLVDRVQHLDKIELTAVFAALLAKRSTSRGRASKPTGLSIEGMAERSPSMLWSIVRAFDSPAKGDVKAINAGVEQLLELSK